MKLQVNKQILSDIINLKRNVFKPLTKFSSKNEVNLISCKFITEKKLFFPLPLLFPIDKTTKKKHYHIMQVQYFTCLLRYVFL